MRSKRISAAQKAAKEKERRKSAVKPEKSESLVGNSKKTQTILVPLQERWPMLTQLVARGYPRPL